MPEDFIQEPIQRQFGLWTTVWCNKNRAEFKNLDFLRRTCILSGCDYLKSIPGVGLAKAFRFMKFAFGREDIGTEIRNMPKIVGLNESVSEIYIRKFFESELVFKYQVVYDPESRLMLPLNDYKDKYEPSELDYCTGKSYAPAIAFTHSLAKLDYQTLEEFTSDDPALDILKNFKPKRNWLSSVRESFVHLIASSSQSSPLPSPHFTSSSGLPPDSGYQQSGKRTKRSQEKLERIMKKIRRNTPSSCPFIYTKDTALVRVNKTPRLNDLLEQKDASSQW